MQGRPLLVAAMLAACTIAGAFSATAQAQTGGTLIVGVTKGGAPVRGAFVAAVGSGANRYGGITSAAGFYAFTGIAADTYVVRASAPGTTAGTQSNVLVTDGGVTNTVVLIAASSTIFKGLGAFGSQTGTIVADGRSGIFYLNTTAIPSLYRTFDHGGTWAPVTISSDDPDNGIDGSRTVTSIATSGFPGEVAGATRTRVYFSRDFGVTWNSFALPGNLASQGVRLYWGHPTELNAPSVMVIEPRAATDGTLYVLDMVTASSTTTLTPMSPSFKQAPNDRLWMTSGSARPVLAVASATTGAVMVYSLSSTASTNDPSFTITGAAPNAPTFVRIGGAVAGPVFSGGAGVAPSTVLVYSHDTDALAQNAQSAARMSTFDAGSTNWLTTSVVEFRNPDNDLVNTSASAAFSGPPGSCGGTASAIGSIAPQGRFGTIASCWVEQDLADRAKLVVRFVRGIDNTAGLAFDAAYDGAQNQVLISGDGVRGAAKSARLAVGMNRPEFPEYPTLATAGTAETSGGISINGLNAAVISDTVFQPGSAANLAVVMSIAGGGRTVASNDAGATWFDLEAPIERGGAAIDWWAGATGSEWILMGSIGGGSLLSAARITATSPFGTTTSTGPLPETSGAELGLPNATGQPGVTAIAGVSGTDRAVVAAASRAITAYASGVVSLVTLAANGTAAVSVISTAFTAGTAPVALTYCPPASAGSAASVADTLFVAVAASSEAGTDGGLYTVHNVASGTGLAVSASALPNTAGDLRDVRAHCGAGTVWVARYTSPGFSGLLQGAGAPLVFAPVTAGGVSVALNRIETLDIDPSDVNHVVAVTRAGDVVATINGGGNWTTLNDTSAAGCSLGFGACGRAFGDLPPGDIEIAPSGSPDRGRDCPQTLCGGEALFGSAAGLYAADTAGTTPGAPGAPTNFVASANGLAVAMAWTAGSGPAAVDYVLEAALDSGFAQIFFAAPISTTTSAFLTAPPGMAGTFFLRVRARNAIGTSAPSHTVTLILPGNAGPPGTPGAPQVQVNPDNSIAVSWAPPAPGSAVTGYRAYLTFGGAPFPGSPFALPAITAVSTPGPLPAGAYSLSMAAVSGVIEGAPSSATTFIVGGCAAPPEAPTGFAISKLGGVSARLAWTAPAGSNPASAYRVQVSLDASFAGVVLDANVGALASLDAVGVPGTFFVRIVPVNACGSGTASNVVMITLP